jgi:two-component system, response regulator PdtaR
VLARELRERYSTQTLFLSGQVAVARSNRDAALGLLAKPYLLEDLNRSVQFIQAYIEGKNPPPPFKPAKLELFVAH